MDHPTDGAMPAPFPPMPQQSYLGDDVSYGYDAEDMRDFAEAYAATMVARVAELEAALHDAVTRMDRARDILTDGKPTPQCNWGILDTNTLRAALTSNKEQQP